MFFTINSCDVHYIYISTPLVTPAAEGVSPITASTAVASSLVLELILARTTESFAIYVLRLAQFYDLSQLPFEPSIRPVGNIF